MSYTITNKPGGHKKIWSVKEGKELLTFDKDNKATIESKTAADKLKKLGYTVTENKDKDTDKGNADAGNTKGDTDDN